jgi:integrase
MLVEEATEGDAMARSIWGSVYRRKDSPNWYVRYPDETDETTASGRTKYVVRAVGTKAQAEKMLELAHAKHILGMPQKPKTESVGLTLAEVVHDHVEEQSRPLSTLRAYRRTVAKLQAHRLGATDPASVTTTDIQRWLTGLGGAASTRRVSLAVVSGALEGLVKAEQLKDNPASRVRKPKIPENPHRVLTASEVAALRKVAKGQILAFVVFALRTGARRAEITALRWRDVDLDGRSVRINRPKVGKVDVIRLHPEVVDELRRHRLECLDVDRVFPPMNGGPKAWRPRGAWERLRDECGIEGAVIHSMRHTFATYYLASGGSLRNLQGILGHASIRTTERYVRMLPDLAGAEVDALRFESGERTASVPVTAAAT